MRRNVRRFQGYVPLPRLKPRAVQKQIAARLIGCDPGLVTRLLLAGRLPTDSDGLIPVQEIERFAVRAITDDEVELTILSERMMAGIRYERLKANGEKP